MTRTLLSQRGPEFAKKAFRANAKEQGLTFKAAAEARNLLPKPKVSIAPGMGRRAHGYMNETRIGRQFVEIGDDEYYESPDNPPFFTDCEICASDESPWVVGSDGGEAVLPPAPTLGFCFEIAKPVKPKGVAKEFEVVDSVKRIIVIDDDKMWEDERQFQIQTKDDDGWEEWEELCCEWELNKGKKKVSYSDVAGGGWSS